MKAKVFSASLLLAGLAFAGTTEVTNEYILGVMPLTISGTEVIINIPWVEAGGGSTIAVSNIVKTANLAVGDTLLWYNPSPSSRGYRVWQLKEDGVGDVRYWEAVSSVSKTGINVVAPDTPALSRGQALILNRSLGTSTTIYIVGQNPEGSATATIYPGYNLLAPPATSGVTDLTKLFGESNAVNGDRIITSEGIGYTWSSDNEKWGNWSYAKGWSFTPVAGSINVPAGKGFWYEHNGEGSFSVNW